MSQVIVWSKPVCVQCNAVKRKFGKHDIAFEELDLSAPEHEAILESFKEQGYMNAPVVTLDGEPIFSGNDVVKIKEHFGV